MKNNVYLALGSNLGDRKFNIDAAFEFLADYGIEIKVRSSFYDTTPVSEIEQARYLNIVCRVATDLDPDRLLGLIKGIETTMGRLRGPVNSPRPIDIDILFFNDEVINRTDLVVPHPRLTERVFVLLPLTEISPGFRHPVSHKTVRELLAGLKWKDPDIIRLE